MKRIALTLALVLAPLSAFAQNTANSTLNPGSMTGSGSGCTPTNCVAVTLPGNAAVAAVTLSGTFSATIQFEVSADGTNFVAANAPPQPSGVLVNSATAAGTWVIPVAGMMVVRARVSAYTSGSVLANVSLSASPYVVPQTSAGVSTPITASNTGAASAANTTLAAVAGKTTYITGFQITGAGATAASIVTVTVTGTITGTMSYNLVVPAGATASITPLVVSFPVPVPASAVNTAIVVNVPSFGTGNTNSAVSAQGFQQ